ncbi:MAG TPA: RNA methyltransferase [Gammaproteobacteria bacterium]
MEIPVRIVLVATSHPGNIGASARAMKTMGLRELVLVAPKHFPHEEATAMASGADDLLAAARVVGSLPEAIADCGYVAGASARLRSVPVATVNPRECAAAVWRATEQGTKAAIVFGPEQSGLTNEDLARCRELVHIPTAPGYGSLNLAMAVQVLTYELRMWRLLEEGGARVPAPASDFPPATAAELEGFHEHLERVLVAAGFLHREHQKQIKLKLRRIFHRAGLDQNEINILRGMLTALDPEKRVGPGSDAT